MNSKARSVQRTYIILMLCNTLAASFIWGINTLFLLDAGLSNTEAFAANAFFTAGLVLFEIPTGVVADLRGRRLSYLLGTVTLAISTILYLLMWQIAAPFWAWAGASFLLGLGFTFFSGATEAWLVDALKFTGFTGRLESVFAKGQIAQGIAMLAGSVLGGVVAQFSNLGVPYIIRAGILIVTFILAWRLMRDLGFRPKSGKHPIREVKVVFDASLQHGLRNPRVRWMMLTSPFLIGVVAYAFYAMQPYLLELYGDESAYWVAGLAAALLAGAQITGGLLVPKIGRLFQRRTTVVCVGVVVGTLALLLMGLIANFWVVIACIVVYGLTFAAVMPVKQAYINSQISSEHRATVLSFDSLLGSAGGVASQPALGKAADVWSYGTSYVLGALFQVLALPFALLARKKKIAADVIQGDDPRHTP
jgi:MFS family permease